MAQDGRARTWTALSLLVCWLVLAADRVDAARPAELLWTCYVAVVVMVVAEAAGLPRLFAAGLLFHVVVGAPAYALQVFVTQRADVAGVVAHLAPAVIGLIAVRARGWPPRVLPVSLGMYGACWAAARLWTDPRLNVNLAHSVWHPLRDHLEPSPLWLLVMAALVVALLVAGDAAARRIRWTHRAPSGGSGG